MDWDPVSQADEDKGPVKAAVFTPEKTKSSTLTIRGKGIHHTMKISGPVMVEQYRNSNAPIDEVASWPSLCEVSTPDKNQDGRKVKAGKKRIVWNDTMHINLLMNWWCHAPSPFYKDNKGKRKEGEQTLKILM